MGAPPPLPISFLVGVSAAVLFAVASFAPLPASAAVVIAPVVVGSAVCADCSRTGVKPEHAFKGLHVAIKCKNGDGGYESKAVGQLDASGDFAVPIAADLVRKDGELRQDCFAQLHSAASTPCPGQEPSRIMPQSKRDGKNTFVAVAGKTHFSSAACSSAFICDPFHKKHFFFHKPIGFHHFHNKPSPEYTPPTPVPVYHPPTPVPVYTPPTPVPSYKPPTPVPVYHPPTPVPAYKPPTPVYTPPTPVPPVYDHPHPKFPKFHHPHPKFPKLPPHHPLLKKLHKKKHHLFPPAKEEGMH